MHLPGIQWSFSSECLGLAGTPTQQMVAYEYPVIYGMFRCSFAFRKQNERKLLEWHMSNLEIDRNVTRYLSNSQLKQDTL